MNLFVGNLAYRLTEDELRAVFEEFGTVASCSIITDKVTGQSRGFGFIDMPDDAEAKRAMAALNGRNVKGRKIEVKDAADRARPDHRHRHGA